MKILIFRFNSVNKVFLIKKNYLRNCKKKEILFILLFSVAMDTAFFPGCRGQLHPHGLDPVPAGTPGDPGGPERRSPLRGGPPSAVDEGGTAAVLLPEDALEEEGLGGGGGGREG